MADDLDAWDAAIERAIMAAATEWAPRVLHAALPTLTAAGLPPDPDRMDDERDSWWSTFVAHVLPVLAGLMAARTSKTLKDRGITPPEPEPDATGPGGEPMRPGRVPPAMTRASDAVPWPADVLAGFSADDRAELVSSFTELRQMLGELMPDDTELIVRIPSWRDGVSEYLSIVSNRCKDMPDTVFNQIRTTLAEGIDAGEDASALAVRVREHLDMGLEGGRDAWNTRAARIARTETTGAYNAATLEAARIEQDETGTEMHKVWVATTDARTRDSHFAADGQRVGLDEPFLIGGERLRYPGDPQAPPSESVNCRCTILELAADEPLPGETDRQTERTRADGSRRDPAGEVASRAADGVTRAREDPAGVGYIAAAAHEEETIVRRPFHGVLAPVGKPTGDGRIIDAAAAITFRDFPLPLMWQKSTSEGHDQSVIVGRIDTASVEGGEIVATGVLFESAEAAETGQLLADEVVRPSVDLCDMVADFLILDADGATVDPEQIDPEQTDGLREMTVVREATVMAATLVAKPAFAEAKLSLGDPTADDGADAEATLVASAGPATMSRIDPGAFANPDLTEPTGLTVTDDGHVYGHLALFDSCHVGMPDRCVTPPRTGSDYAYFHTSTVDTPDGPVSVGRLTVGCGHAQARAGLHAAAEHYDDTGTCWAYVRAGEDAHGIWVAGIVNPDASETSIRAGAAAPLSGDWRTVGGRLELVAALSVNTPGFPVPRTYASDTGRSMSLVAAGAVQTRPRRRLDAADMQAVAEAAVDAYVVRQQRATEAAAIRSRVAAREAARLTARHRGNR